MCSLTEPSPKKEEQDMDRCPNRYSKYEDSPDLCDFNDKVCLLESGDRCEYWEEVQLEEDT